MNPAGSENTRNLGKQNRTVDLRSLDHREVGGALGAIRDVDVWWAVKACLIFLVLTCVRSREAREATWDEVDFETATWTIPATRMKTGIEHRVPLSAQAMEVLAYARSQGGGRQGAIFPTQRSGRYMDSRMLSRLMKNLEILGVPHGFRASFMNWAGERPHISAAAAAAVLAHTPSNRIMKALRTSDFLNQSRPVMEEWGDYVTETMEPVVPAIPSSQ